MGQVTAARGSGEITRDGAAPNGSEGPSGLRATGPVSPEDLAHVDLGSATRIFDSLIRLVSAFSTRRVMRFYLDRANVEVDPAHYEVLRSIGIAGPLRLRDLAESTNMTPSNASKIVAELVDSGLVLRHVPASDRRVTLLEVTPDGAEAVERLDAAGHELMAERMIGLSDQEVTQLDRLLAHLTDDVVAWSAALRAELAMGVTR